MSLDIGFTAQTPSLPNVAGAVGGLGETFSPDLSTGTATLSMPLDLPNGPNDIGMKLALRYDAGASNGPFGLGVSLPLPRLLRSIAQGYPFYDNRDTLMLEGAGPLLALGGGGWRPVVDDGSWRIEQAGAGFLATDRAGLRYSLGQSAEVRLVADPTAAAQRVLAWHLERIDDALGNSVKLAWMRDGGQLYLARVDYGVYSVQFGYKTRPDPLRSGRSGFAVQTRLRCETIELRMPGEAQPLLRRWLLGYAQAAVNNASLLVSFRLSGHDANGGELSSPALTFGYSEAMPATLSRFTAEAESAPGLISRNNRRVELLDWNGDGLPEMLEIGAGGEARVWPNEGNCRWGSPRSIGELPMLADANAALALADMNGDGLADLLRADLPLGGYTPRLAGGGFGEPVAWRQAPAPAPMSRSTRLLDLNGDGIADMLASSREGLAAFYRTSDAEGGWESSPRIALVDPPVRDLADPHVFVADMTGDGSEDLVRVDGGGVTYWPALGNGRWDAPVTMADPPELPFDVRPERLFLADLDGDGCADLVYLDGGRLIFWINRTGNGFAPPVVIDPVPTGQFGEFRFADMTGAGAAGILWSAPGPFGRGAAHLYLEPMGGSRPSLLTRIDNGVGQSTAISYSTSARHAAADASKGRPWPGILPIVVPVVETIDVIDAATGTTSTTRLRYHDGRYDGLLREFCGYGAVEREDIGDESVATLRTLYWFATGLDPSTGEEPSTAGERQRWRAIRGRMLKQERYGADGSASADRPYDRMESRWTVTSTSTSGGNVYLPRLAATIQTNIERGTIAASVTATTHDSWDESGNVTATTQTVTAPEDPGRTRMLRTVARYAHDPAGRFLGFPWRVQQFDGATLIADTISEYDHALEGRVDAQGLITKRSSLAMSDSLVAEIYGLAPPDLTKLGYWRRPGETGWWVDQGRYERIDAGQHGKITSALGAVTSLDFDSSKTCPIRVTDAAGNALQVQSDLRLCRVVQITAPDGSERAARYDALARITAEINPGDSDSQPTIGYEYVTASFPIEAITRRRAVSGRPDTIDARELHDGAGRLLEARERDKAGEVVRISQRYNARGLPARIWQEFRPASASYAAPDATRPHDAITYDALGRPLRRLRRDGGLRTLSYAPLMIEEFDEEDTLVGGPHAGTPTRKWFSPSGQLVAIEQNLSGRLVRSTYEYDIKGNLITHTDALGHATRFDYDLLGRRLRVRKPESTLVNVFDAGGNLAEVHPLGGEPTYVAFDVCNRPSELRTGGPDAAPQTRWTYHDAGRPTPADAGSHTIGGHCVRIDDGWGSTVFDYDDVGRTAMKRLRTADGARNWRIDIVYRADGQPANITFPDGGGGRFDQRYEYDERGNVVRVPSIVKNITYDLGGRRTQVDYNNGTTQAIVYDPASLRLASMTLSGPTGVIRATTFTTDRVGNVLSIGSPDAGLARNYTYDDLYRLTTGSGGGRNWAYGYDDAANLTQTTDMGALRYGEGGAAPNCLTSAGNERFTYTPAGQMAETPWGTQSFDPLGRLISIHRGSDAVDFTYDFSGNCVASRSSGGVAPAVDRLTPDKMFALEGGSLVINIFDGSGVIARRSSSGATVWLHADHLGSLVVVTDSHGEVSETRDYDPYGARIDANGPGVPIGFTGGEPNAWSGLINLGARFYQPGLGRFVSPDPVVQDPGLPVAWSAYVYCAGNPTSFVDPGGRSFWGVVGGIVGGVAGFFVGGPAGAVAGAAAGAAVGGDSGPAKAVLGVVTDPRFWASVAAVAALVALTALSIVTFGATVPLLVVGIAVVAGGLIGGIATAQAKGATWEDVVTGALVGAAVGGWAAFAGVYAGAGAVAGVNSGLSSLFGSGTTIGATGGGLLSGAVNGAIAGAASGFTTGFAGGKGKWDWEKFGDTVLVGAVVGGILGGTGIVQVLKDSASGAPAGLGTSVATDAEGAPQTILSQTIKVDPLQSFFQAAATTLGTAAKISDASNKGLVKFGFGILEYDAEAMF